MAARKAAKKSRKAGTARKKPVKATSGRKSRKKAASGAAPKARSPKLYTLTEVGRLASVSMPTLQKYKRMYADRIPSVGEGRKQRYPRTAVAVLRQLKKENLAKRGRPPKAGGSKARAAARRSPAARRRQEGLLTLTEISRRTKISYPTVSRYVKLFLHRIPHEGSGRLRRFPKEAVAVFKQLRSESRPGRPPSSGKPARATGATAGNAALNARLRKLERAQADLAKQIANVVRLLKKPLQVTIKGR